MFKLAKHSFSSTNDVVLINSQQEGSVSASATHLIPNRKGGLVYLSQLQIVLGNLSERINSFIKRIKLSFKLIRTFIKFYKNNLMFCFLERIGYFCKCLSTININKTNFNYVFLTLVYLNYKSSFNLLHPTNFSLDETL